MDREELCRYVDVSRRHIGCRSGNGIIQCSPVQPIQLIFNLVCDILCPDMVQVQWSAVRVTPSGNPGDLNLSRTLAGITKWFWVTLEGYRSRSYLLPKFQDLVPTSLGSGAI